MSNKPERKSFDAPDETTTFDKGHIELVNLGGIFGRATFEPGWRWSECVKPLVGTDSCQATHTGYGISGRIRVVMDDGTEFESGLEMPPSRLSTSWGAAAHFPHFASGISRIGPAAG